MSDDRGQPALALNVGSQSFKFDFFMVGESSNRVLLSGAEKTLADPQSAVARIVERIVAQGLPAPAAVGHRITHACLDTAFHARMPDVARRLPLPHELRALGIERFGFHGLSGESIVRQLGSDLPTRLAIAHLGHGASVTAVAHGASVDTSGSCQVSCRLKVNESG